MGVELGGFRVMMMRTILKVEGMKK